jgi:thioredoxin reductase (NADPH)
MGVDLPRLDTVIIGGGIAGLSAAMHCSMMGLDFVVIQKTPFVGQIPEGHLKKNYPGVRNIKGVDLAQAIEDQATLDFSVDIKREEVTDIVINSTVIPHRFLVKTDHGHYLSRSVIIASGSRPQKIKGVDSSLTGITYYPLFDASDFSKMDVLIIGLNDYSVQFTYWLKDIASSITIIEESQHGIISPMNNHELDSLLVESDIPIQVMTNQRVIEFIGDKEVTGVQLENTQNGSTNELSTGAIILSGKRQPNSELAEKMGCELDKSGHIIVNREQKTEVEGAFAAGDVAGVMYSAIKSAGEGSVAGMKLAEYLETGTW